MKTCIITGAGSGIGRATAIEVAKLNEFDNFVLLGRNENTLIETSGLMQQNCNVHICKYDLENISEISKLVSDLFCKFGSIDCLLNIAGFTDPKSILETTNDSLLKTFSINVFAPYILCREVAKYMKTNNDISKILNVASTAGISARPGWSSYAMSKAALIEMSITLSEEFADYGIKVYCVSPGRCATELRKVLAPEEDQSKIMQPLDVGIEIARLISDKEHCLDGQNIIIRKKF